MRFLVRFIHPSTCHRISKCMSRRASDAVSLPRSELLSHVRDSNVLKREVLNMLQHLRDRRPYINDAYLLHATYFSWKTDLEHEFADVAGEWFRQARPRAFDGRKFVKASSALCNLGKLNRLTDGYLMEKLGWPPIEYFMRRMAEIGFHRLHAEDIASAASGLQDLILIRTAIDDKPRRLSPEFLGGLRQYLKVKQPTDPDWEDLIRVTAPYLLYNLSNIYPDQRPTMDILSPLCRLTKLGFDRMATDEKTLESIRIEHLIWTVRTFLRGWELNPDLITRNFWSSWFQVCGVILRESRRNDRIKREISFQFLRELITVAHVFNRFQDFESLLKSWYRCAKDLCRRVSELTVEPTEETVEVQIDNFVHAIGQFANAANETKWNLKMCRRLFENLLPLLESALVSRPFSALSFQFNARWLIGVRDAKKELQLTYEPSKEYYRFLHDWCIHIQSLEKPPPRVSSGAAMLLRLLKDLNLRIKPPPKLLREMVNLFWSGFGSLNDIWSLSSFSTSAATFAIVLDVEQREKYFSKVHSLLVDSQVHKADKSWILFLCSIEQLTFTNGMYEYFILIKDIYEKRLGDSADYFIPKQAFFLAKGLELANRQHDLQFDASLIKKLDAVGESCRRY